MSNRLVLADGPLLERILDFTFPVWNEGLSRPAYGQWNSAQLRTAWGRDHLHRFALIDEQDRLLASAKRYRFDVRLDDADVRMSGIGAVFTPPGLRGHGYASEMLTQLLEQERGEGAALASLFSEIGTPFYERLGFVLAPLDEVDVEVTLKGGSPAMLVRGGDDRDVPALAALHETRSAGVRFALRRDPSLIQYALSKKRMQSGLGPQSARYTEFFVAEEGASAVAYAIITVTAGGWTLEEFGDRDPAGARVGAMLQVLLAREPAQKPPRIRTWWPRAVAVPPQLTLARRGPSRDQFMIKPLADVRVPASADDLFYWRSDYF